MARYTGPKRKIERRFNESIFSNKPLEKKKYPPGQHGSLRRRKKNSNYSIQLLEKQKIKYIYGILEKQLIKMFHDVSKIKGITGELLLQLCESRLDNVIYRLKIAPSRRSARQLVSHKHITVNNKVINIPSFILQPGDIIGIKEKSKKLQIINDSLINSHKNLVSWLSYDEIHMTGVFKAIPLRNQIPENVKENLIVELYSK